MHQSYICDLILAYRACVADRSGAGFSAECTCCVGGGNLHSPCVQRIWKGARRCAGPQPTGAGPPALAFGPLRDTVVLLWEEIVLWRQRQGLKLCSSSCRIVMQARHLAVMRPQQCLFEVKQPSTPMDAHPEVSQQGIIEVHAHGMDHQVQVLVHSVLLRRHACHENNAAYRRMIEAR